MDNCRWIFPATVLGAIFALIGLPQGARPGPAQVSEEAWKTSPFHGVIDGNGRIIPCLCVYRGKKFRLGETVCMATHLGTVMTRCDLLLNNTSWVPTNEPCTLSVAPTRFDHANRRQRSAFFSRHVGHFTLVQQDWRPDR